MTTPKAKPKPKQRTEPVVFDTFEAAFQEYMNNPAGRFLYEADPDEGPWVLASTLFGAAKAYLKHFGYPIQKVDKATLYKRVSNMLAERAKNAKPHTEAEKGQLL